MEVDTRETCERDERLGVRVTVSLIGRKNVNECSEVLPLSRWVVRADGG